MSRDVLPVTSLALSIIALGLSAFLLGNLSGVSSELEALSSEIAQLSESVETIETKIEAGPSALDLLFGAAVEGASDRAKVGAAKAELATVKQGLGMYQAEDDYSRYPSTGRIGSYSDLRSVVGGYVQMPTEVSASFTFVSYRSDSPETFTLLARAGDLDRTLITVTPTSITP